MDAFAGGIVVPRFHIPDYSNFINYDNLLTPINKVKFELENYKHILKIGHLNTVSIPKHRDEINRLMGEIDFDIFGASETNIKPGTPANLFRIPGYKLIRADRTVTTKGGVGIYFKEDFFSQDVNKKSPEQYVSELTNVTKANIVVTLTLKTRHRTAATSLEVKIHQYNFKKTWQNL